MEVLREERTKGPPIRRTFVAWGVIRREGRFILKRRENREDDPDNALHGNYGFPGGRVNLRDLKEWAGIAVPTIARPWTRDEFDAALKRHSELPDYEFAVDMSVWDTAEWWPYVYAPMLQSFGGDIIDRDILTTADGFLNGSFHFKPNDKKDN